MKEEFSTSTVTAFSAERRLPLVVFAHVFYPDIWADMLAAIDEAIDCPFRVVVTCSDPELHIEMPRSSHLVSWTRITTENRGRDVLPFLIALRSDLPDFEIGLKLHTKRSPQRADGGEWRRYILASLLQRNANRIAAVDLLDNNSAIGLIAPHNHLMPLTNTIVFNRRNLKVMMAATGSTIPMPEFKSRCFSAGTMFWFRRDAIAAFVDHDLESLFKAERSQLDGTAAHAAERLFAHVAQSRGYLVTAGEAVGSLRGAAGATINDQRALNRSLLKPFENPYIGFRPFWRRHPHLFEVYSVLRFRAVRAWINDFRSIC